ncbi:MAG: PEGA domain-containing protein [Candidatus Sulfotelmatobacter sp.]
MNVAQTAQLALREPAECDTTHAQMAKPHYLRNLVFLLVSTTFLLAKNEPGIVMMWPADKPALKLTFEKFRQMASHAGQNTFISDVTVLNLTDKQIPRATFTVYLMDKNKVRIGEGVLQVSELEAGQAAKLQFQCNAVGVPAALALSAKKDMLAQPAAKTIPLKIISVPAGAKLKVDGQEAGTTPIMVRLTVGVHQLDMTKDGYAPGNTPLEVTADELPGGSITVELGGLLRDTLELRDGSLVLCDVLSVTMTQVMVRVDGKDRAYDRNQVKRIMLVEREVIEPAEQSHP